VAAARLRKEARAERSAFMAARTIVKVGRVATWVSHTRN